MKGSDGFGRASKSRNPRGNVFGQTGRTSKAKTWSRCGDNWPARLMMERDVNHEPTSVPLVQVLLKLWGAALIYNFVFSYSKVGRDRKSLRTTALFRRDNND